MLNKNEIEKIHNELTAAATAVLKKHNLKLNPSVLRYTSSSISMKIVANLTSNDGSVILPHEVQNVMLWKLTGAHPTAQIPKKIIGEEFEIEKLGICKVLDYKLTSKKYPFVVETAEGVRYKVSPQSFIFY